MGKVYDDDSSPDSKRGKGQFFTPLVIAKFMGSLSGPSEKEISILDPGCGCAILSTCLIEHLIEHNQILKVHLDAYETDLRVVPFTKAVLGYLKVWLQKSGVSFTYLIKEEDFVLSNYNCLKLEPQIFDDQEIVLYDYIISNPPFFKLAKDDDRVIASSSIVNGQTNIYALFVAVSSRMLKSSGQMIVIIPRSFASGRYFELFREFLFCNISPDFIHLFNTRKETFAKDDVLQELLIMSCHSSCSNKSKEVVVSYSNGVADLDNTYRKSYSVKEIVDFESKEKVLYLPVCHRDEEVLRLFKSWEGNLSKYDIKISTGPVIAFRNKQFLLKTEEYDTVPLYWSHNVVKMLCYHPVEKKERCQYIRVEDGSLSCLLQNKNYILLRRFSAKDDESRLVAAPYFGNGSKYKYVGIENKLNYIYRPDGRLTRSEVMGIAALLNSKLFDSFFRTFNGNINVSATELRMMPFPPLDTIKKIGNKIILSNDYSIDYINKIVSGFFNI